MNPEQQADGETDEQAALYEELKELLVQPRRDQRKMQRVVGGIEAVVAIAVVNALAVNLRCVSGPWSTAFSCALGAVAVAGMLWVRVTAKRATAANEARWDAWQVRVSQYMHRDPLVHPVSEDLG